MLPTLHSLILIATLWLDIQPFTHTSIYSASCSLLEMPLHEEVQKIAEAGKRGRSVCLANHCFEKLAHTDSAGLLVMITGSPSHAHALVSVVCFCTGQHMHFTVYFVISHISLIFYSDLLCAGWHVEEIHRWSYAFSSSVDSHYLKAAFTPSQNGSLPRFVCK